VGKIRIETLASAFRELRQKIDIVPFDTDVSEESISLSPQRFIDPQKWGVATIETWNNSRNSSISVRQIWDEMIYFLGTTCDEIEVTFRYFMDGIQRTTPIGKIRLRKNSFEMAPIHFAQIGIVLLQRDKGILTRADDRMRLFIEYPNDFVMSLTTIKELKDDMLGYLKERVGGAFESVDTSYRIARLKESEKESFSKTVELDGIKYPRVNDEELWQWCADPAQFRNQARRWTTRYRDIAEQELYDNALERFGGKTSGNKYEFVLKDGPLTHVRGDFTRAALGVVKSFNTNFLEITQMTRVLGLPCGYRSPVFTKTRPDGDPEEETYDDLGHKSNSLISWYIRIRPVGRHDPTWGLLRIEMHQQALPCQGHAGRWNKLDTLIVDAISRQLLFEANPSSHPDPRWHNLIYPIKVCESFARSRILPNVTARYLLGGT